jgi:hypothetical protein
MKNIRKYRKAIGDDKDIEAQQPDPHQSHREGTGIFLGILIYVSNTSTSQA